MAYVRSKEKKRLQSVNKDNIKDFPKSIPSPQHYSVFVEPKRKEPKPVIYTQVSLLQLNQNGMIESIRSYLGTPYRWGGSSRYGIDCSSHVGIYIGNGQFVRATTREGVAVSSFNKRSYRIRYVGAKRLV
jgi:hypothetical protein